MDVAKPFEQHPHYQEVLSRIELVDALEGGSRAMRRAGEKWLPRFAAESKEEYGERLRLSRLAPIYKRGLTFHADRVFEKPVKVRAAARLPARWDEIRRDIDGMGTTLQQWSYRFFKLGEHHGIAHVLADSSIETAPVNDSRGYLRLVSARQLYNWKHEGQELVEVRISERDNDGESVARIIRPTEWGVFREKDQEQIDGGEWGLGYIPFVSWRTTPPLVDEEWDEFVPVPYLMETAEIALDHYRSYSVQQSSLSIARRPKYLAKGLGKGWKPQAMGGSMLININGDELENAEFRSITEEVQTLELGYKDLDRLREEAALETGQSLLHDQPGTRTATERALDSAEASCGVQRLANVCADAINEALFHLGQFSGVDMVDTVELNQDVAISVGDDLEALWRLATDFGVAPSRMREMLLDEYSRRGIISPSTNKKGLLEEAEEIVGDESDAEEVLERARRLAAEQGDSLDTDEILRNLREGSTLPGATES